jgi:ADP-ribose pyrophosphatase YjhB (NUDIX family)
LTINHPELKKQFCHVCGNRLIEKFWEGRCRPFCLQCRLPVYENPVPASAIVVVDKNTDLLLVKRNVDPKKGYWSLPGGFMELSETPGSSALRELREETGLTATLDVLLGLKAHKSERYGTVLIAGYLVTDYSGDLIAGDDAEAVAFFQPGNLPEIAFSSHDHFIRIALEYMAGEPLPPPETQ